MLSDWINPESLFMRNFFGIDRDLPVMSRTIPSVNIRETENELLFEFAAPGLERKDFTIELDEHVLRVSSEKEETTDEKDKGYFRKEYSYNSFERSFSLPQNVREQDITAKYEDGILKVIVPKLKATKPETAKKISIG
jgi:HSP20 family protein